MTVIYDGSFESFLTIVYEVYYSKIKVSAIEKQEPSSLFMDEYYFIQYEEAKAQKVLEALKKKFSKKNFEMILNMFMCESIEFELELLQFVVLGFKDQKQLENINYPFVFNIQRYQKELFHVVHKMKGFTRFEELEDGTLYAKIETKFNIVYFLGKHFIKRFNNQEFIIHDVNRKLAFIKNKNYMGVQNIESFDIPIVSNQEEKFQHLWKTFFDSVAIESRKNKKLQNQLVPLIYRTYMNEFNRDL